MELRRDSESYLRAGLSPVACFFLVLVLSGAADAAAQSQGDVEQGNGPIGCEGPGGATSIAVSIAAQDPLTHRRIFPVSETVGSPNHLGEIDSSWPDERIQPGAIRITAFNDRSRHPCADCLQDHPAEQSWCANSLRWWKAMFAIRASPTTATFSRLLSSADRIENLAAVEALTGRYWSVASQKDLSLDWDLVASSLLRLLQQVNDEPHPSAFDTILASRWGPHATTRYRADLLTAASHVAWQYQQPLEEIAGVRIRSLHTEFRTLPLPATPSWWESLVREALKEPDDGAGGGQLPDSGDIGWLEKPVWRFQLAAAECFVFNVLGATSLCQGGAYADKCKVPPRGPIELALRASTRGRTLVARLTQGGGDPATRSADLHTLAFALEDSKAWRWMGSVPLDWWPGAVALLLEAMKNPDPAMRSSACEALRKVDLEVPCDARRRGPEWLKSLDAEKDMLARIAASLPGTSGRSAALHELTLFLQSASVLPLGGKTLWAGAGLPMIAELKGSDPAARAWACSALNAMRLYVTCTPDDAPVAVPEELDSIERMLTHDEQYSRAFPLRR